MGVTRTLKDQYWKLYRWYWRTYASLAPVKATKSWYKKQMGKPLNLENPQTLTEKLQYLKVNDYFHNPLVTQCADKYAVREFIKSKGCEEILNELYSVYNSASEINWGGVPDSFVLKCNHGCGGNIICRDKSKLDTEDAGNKLDYWMHTQYGLEHVEFSYEGIPRKIICEKVIETEDGQLPRDYKIFCSYGEPKLIYVISERKENTENLDYFTPEWEWIPVRNGILTNSTKPIEKPQNLDVLLDYARKLSKDFPIVRVDLYSEFGKVTFGELTFLPTGGTFHLNPPEYDLKFGELFPLK